MLHGVSGFDLVEKEVESGCVFGELPIAGLGGRTQACQHVLQRIIYGRPQLRRSVDQAFSESYDGAIFLIGRRAGSGAALGEREGLQPGLVLVQDWS